MVVRDSLKSIICSNILRENKIFLGCITICVQNRVPYSNKKLILCWLQRRMGLNFMLDQL